LVLELRKYFQQQADGWRFRVLLIDLSNRRPGPGELILVLYGGPRWSFW
jgi:hypothetical protein